MYDFKVKSSSLNCVIGSSESFSDGLETVKREREREREVVLKKKKGLRVERGRKCVV